jgi:D-alanyl-D-alanine carboxypeptidase/D-alanyl-D-alanine-endopeptidase (penicillin-binding protein 4)
MLHAGSCPQSVKINYELMRRTLVLLILLLNYQIGFSQERAAMKLLNDQSMIHGSASIKIISVENAATIFDYDADKCLMPASVQKLVTSAAALELLGPEFRFTTRLAFSGDLNKKTGLLKGNIFIIGGGDPALGSLYFTDQYKDFIKKWIAAIKDHGIKKIEGKVISDDSRYDYQPVPPKWLWEDIGNYYGAGTYGLSVFDNMFEIHFKTSSEGSVPIITGFVPHICENSYSNFLSAKGTSDNGYVFAVPYNDYGWIAGTIPPDENDFILKASITDPPLLMAKLFDSMLDSAGIEISGEPSTTRLNHIFTSAEMVTIDEIHSPTLNEIIEILNHESVNLYAEHLIKELGKTFSNEGTTANGIQIVKKFLDESGVGSGSFFIEDGSGMSPMNAISSSGLTDLLYYMKNRGRYFDEFLASLPAAGIEGTLKSYFRSDVFRSNLKAKSGSMTRVRSYAGYFKAKSGKEMIFSIIINNFSGSSGNIVGLIEEILQETILNN